MSERSKRWEEFETNTIPEYIEKIKNEKKQLKQSRDKLYDTIEELGDKIKEFLPEDEVSSILKHYLKGTISTRTIERALNKKKKNTEEYTSQSATLSQIEVKKVIEVSAGTGTQTVTEPPKPNVSQPQSQTQSPQPETRSHVTPTTTTKRESSTKEQEQEGKDFNALESLRAKEKENEELKSRVLNLEQQLKIITERRKVKIDSSKLQIDDGRTFENTIILQTKYASWMAERIREYITKFPKLDYIPVQQDSSNIDYVRLNLKKPEFKT